ncbi:MAG: putative toxin-antitoxin system toxin component, PIN family [Lentisphaerae bacterium RIFOXYB12_FULL_65_16]|nr:MAG: putative toxin-antitoxin system toxin component, PIN family [Lentisphaerae bacterium RIFOXYA12_64_32]OGV90700.1 MAG: putative toxin-antitoxin system toxin component, PIN family [Lentisphaerae bacterium RIFOXYB12_FULL_65_16]
MTIVLDTNVLVSSFLSPHGPPADTVRIALAGVVELVVDARILAEYRDVLTRPEFDFPPDKVEAFLHDFEALAEMVTPTPCGVSLPDEDDLPFLECAIAGQADYLVTGNPRHFPAPAREFVTVLSPREFMALFRPPGRSPKAVG